MKTKLFLFVGIFLMVFGIDGFLLLDSSVPECKGFIGMALFVFVTLGFDSRAILSNPDCLESFAGQIINIILFMIGCTILVCAIIQRKKNEIQNSQQDIFT